MPARVLPGPLVPELTPQLLTSSSANPCEDGESICNLTYQVTDNSDFAEMSDWLIGKPLVVLGFLVAFFVLRWLLLKVIDRVVKRAENGMLPDRVTAATSARRVQRVKTLGSLLKSIVVGVLIGVLGTMMLSELGVNVAPIIASAGIIGIAIGFGAQSLVSDFLSGIFMIFEDQYGVGDEVDLGEAYGTVEAVSLRVTRLRDVNGTVWYVRNGEILRVGNTSQNWARTVLDISVAYSEDLVKVKRVLAEVAHDLWEDEDFEGRVIEEPSVWGVQDLAADGVTVRVALKTAPLEQWAVAREMRQRIKARFDHEGIEMPFAQRVVWHRTEGQDAGAPTPSGPGTAVAD